MDSLLANYASDDDDEHEQERVEEEEKAYDVSAAAAKSLQLPPPKPSSSSSLFSSSLPLPKSSAALPSSSSSSLFSSLPPPKSLSSSTPSLALQNPSRPKSSHLGEVDGDEEEKRGIFTTGTPSSSPFKAQSSIFSALPPPKSSSSSSRPKSSLHGEEDGEEEEDKAGSFTTGTPSSTPFKAQNSLFSALPLPKDSSIPPAKSDQPNPQKTTNSLSSDRNPKRIVQFKLPLNPSVLKSRDFDDDDDDEEEKGRRGVKDSSSGVPKASSSVSSLLPAPKNTFGLVSSAASATSRRSIVDADVPASNAGDFTSVPESSGFGDLGGYEGYNGGWVGAPDKAGVDEAKDLGFPGSSTGVGWDPSGVEGTTYSGFDGSSNDSYWDPSYGGAAGAMNYGNYEGNWSESTAIVASEAPDMGWVSGKRGRNEIPTEIMEVKQDELMKNRPRQDQAKLTGIAFGPSYQPTSSAKAKPSKLHKRKHQIGSLYYDMRQKEMELAERRAKGLLTKAETQAKYGW